METDRNKYAVNLQNMDNLEIIRYIESKEAQLQEVSTQLEMAWEQLYYRGVVDHK